MNFMNKNGKSNDFLTDQVALCYHYEGNQITFKKEGETMVNAGEMAAAFGKKPNHWLRNRFAQEFIENYCELRNRNPSEIIQIVNGRGGTTWMHEDIAMEFARWLSPKFAFWCNDRIKELLTTGQTTINDISRKQLAQMLLDAEIEKEIAEERAKMQEIELKKAAPKVEYYNNVMQSTSAMPITLIAKDLGMSGIALNNFLKKHNVIYKVGGTYVLYSKYQGQGYTHTKTHYYTNSKGDVETSLQLYWTQKGRQFIIDLFNKHNDIFVKEANQ